MLTINEKNITSFQKVLTPKEEGVFAPNLGPTYAGWHPSLVDLAFPETAPGLENNMGNFQPV